MFLCAVIFSQYTYRYIFYFFKTIFIVPKYLILQKKIIVVYNILLYELKIHKNVDVFDAINIKFYLETFNFLY